MRTRVEQKSETRRRILDEATRLIARQGFAATRTADVAKQAGLSHGAVFVHFPTREDLVIEVAFTLAREITDRLHEAVTDGAPLRDVLGAHLRCLEEREDLYRFLVLERTHLPPAFRTAWIGLQSAIAHHIGEAAERAIAAREIQKMPLDLLFNGWIGLVHHYLANRDLFVTRGSVLAKHGRTLLDHYCSLLSTRRK